MADGFTTGQIRALPFLQGALDAYRRQGATRSPDTSTVHESKASAPVTRSAENRPDTSTVHELEGRSPLGRDAGLGKPSILPAAYADGARSRHPDRPTDRCDPTDRSGPRLDVNQAPLQPPGPGKRDVKVTPLCHHQNPLQIQSLNQNPQILAPDFLTLLRYIVKPQGRGAPDRGPEEEKTSPPTGATALPVSLPVSGSGRKRPAKRPQKHSQGRIIDIMLNNMFLPIFTVFGRPADILFTRRIAARIPRRHVVGCPPVVRGVHVQFTENNSRGLAIRHHSRNEAVCGCWMRIGGSMAAGDG